MKKKDTELDKLVKKDIDESEEEKEKPEESEKKSFDIKSIKLLPLLAIVLLSFIIVIVLIWLLLSDKKTTPVDQKEIEKTATIDESEKEEPLVLYSFDPFFVPLVGSPKEKNFLQIDLNAELSSTMLKKEIKTSLPEIRSSIFKIITSKSIADIKDEKGKKRLKSEIIAKLNSLVRSGTIKEIYFSQFIIQ